MKKFPSPRLFAVAGAACYRHQTIQLHLSVEDLGADNQTSRRHICFVVADLRAAKATMREADVEIIPDNRPIDGWRRFYVRDRGGNRIEIAQRTGDTK